MVAKHRERRWKLFLPGEVGTKPRLRALKPLLRERYIRSKVARNVAPLERVTSERVRREPRRAGSPSRESLVIVNAPQSCAPMPQRDEAVALLETLRDVQAKNFIRAT